MSQPETKKNIWTENEEAVIQINSFGNCSVPQSVEVNWKLRLPNEELKTLNEKSLILNISKVKGTHRGSYFYEIFDDKGNEIFESNEVSLFCKHNFVAIH